MAKRLTRKEIKQPDQFVSSSVQLMEWAKGHVSYLLYGMFGIIAIAVIFVAWSMWQTQRQRQAEALLYETVKLLSPNAERSNIAPRQALDQLQRIVERFGGTPASAFAHWYLGHQHYVQGDYIAALAAYRQAQQGFSAHQDLFLPVLVSLNIGYAYEASGQCRDAIGVFEGVLQSSLIWLHGDAIFGIGRCHEKTGARTEAIATYDRALSETAIDPATRQKIEEQRTRLLAAQSIPK